ncbi:MAG: 30S ribosomal protein S12 methylthiotransferase RimO [Phycisphaerae bacterium]
MAWTKPTRVCLVSLGCPKNLVDSERMLGLLAEGGCVVAAPMDKADVIVVNTCGFLSAARDESLSVIEEALAYRRSGSARRVIVAGCLVNRDADKLFDLAPGIDAIVGVNERDSILRAVMGTGRPATLSHYSPGGRAQQRLTASPHHDFPPGTATGGNPKSEIQTPKTDCRQSAIHNSQSAIASDSSRFRLTPRHTAYLRISEGCSRRCTFCTIPAIRGPFRSKPPAEVMKEARELVADGAVELNVIGQDTTAYGTDFGSPDGSRTRTSRTSGLAALLRKLDRLDGVRWIRLMYAYPRSFADELIAAVAECPRVVKYIDLPLQHISDAVLRRMGRRTTRKATEELLSRLRERIPGLVLRTTFIVGFPGETESQFGELLAFVKDFRFDALGVFEYSREEGTPAAALPGQISAEVKAERAAAIMLAQRRIAFAANRRRIGRRVEVLVDGKSADGRCVGRHYGQAPDIDSVCILKRPRRPGGFVKTQIIGASEYDLIVD